LGIPATAVIAGLAAHRNTGRTGLSVADGQMGIRPNPHRYSKEEGLVWAIGPQMGVDRNVWWFDWVVLGTKPTPRTTRPETVEDGEGDDEEEGAASRREGRGGTAGKISDLLCASSPAAMRRAWRVVAAGKEGSGGSARGRRNGQGKAKTLGFQILPLSVGTARFYRR